MSASRPIWNDGQGLATPDLQRGEDIAATADDRAHEVYSIPAIVPKKVTPLVGDFISVPAGVQYNAVAFGLDRLTTLAIPSAAASTPAGVNGAVRLLPCMLVAGDISGTIGSSQRVSLAGNNYSVLDSTAITSNSSGSIRYDLVYATLNRTVTVTGTRKIKSATDGTLSSPTVNLADAPTITLGINPGFLTGATPPTLAQIYAALPSDTAPGSSTFGSFKFPIAYVTVANGYVSGTVLSLDSSAGTSYIVQAWPKEWHSPWLVRGTRPMGIFYSSQNEHADAPGIQNGIRHAERWGSDARFFGILKLLTSTGTTLATGVNVDDTIDWSRRFIWGFYSYLGAGNNVLPFETHSSGFTMPPTTASTNNLNTGVLPPMWTGTGGQAATCFYFTNTTSFLIGSDNGILRVARNTAAIDGTNGDVIVLHIQASDQLRVSA